MLRAVREDEDAARALGKNAFSYKLQSLAIAADDRRDRRLLPRAEPEVRRSRRRSCPLVTFIGYAVLVLGGLANYWGVAVGSIVLWTILEGLRFLDLPLSPRRRSPRCASSSSGLILIGLMAFRPQGVFGKREEMVLGD